MTDKRKIFCSLGVAVALLTTSAFAANATPRIEVRVRQTPGGPRIFVDGKAVTPRFYYGSPPCLGPISQVWKNEYVIPFIADADTSAGRVAIDGYDDDEPMWFSSPFLEDRTSWTTNALPCEGEERTRHFSRDGLAFKKGHYYHFHVTHRAARSRTYFRHEVAYAAAGGEKRVLPLPYGDTLCDTARMAFVCASKGYAMVQAQEEGVIPLDFGQAEAVDDAITGATVGTGPRVNVQFRLGETRLFKAENVSSATLAGGRNYVRRKD